MLVGAAAVRRGREERIALALATGLVTLPAYGLGTALLFTGGGAGAALAALPMVAVLGFGALVGGAAIAGTIGRQRPRRRCGTSSRRA